MKRLLAFALFFVAVSAFAHAGHMHTYMGTVTMLHGDGVFMMKTTDGHDVSVETTAKTAFTDVDNHPAKLADVAVGTKVVVKMNVDRKTAASVKLAK
ncbi:MAG TPA: hypothetical protein VII75_15415 [Thermoanaerobaculia bacterium]|nr:hypothetical protein [Thermoanaerobaculia bacterium]